MRPKRPEDARLRKFEPAENAPALNCTRIQPGEHRVTTDRDLYTDKHSYELFADDGMTHNNDTGWTYGSSSRRRYSITSTDPRSAEASLSWTKDYVRDNWSVSILADIHMSVTEDHYLIHAELDAYEGEARAYSNQWNCKIPRDHG